MVIQGEQTQRTVHPKTALAVISWIGPDFSMEDAMRLLFPEEAERIGNYIHVYIRLLYTNLSSILALYLTTSV